MGCQKAKSSVEGLVDCSSLDFQQKLVKLRGRWKKFDGDDFYEWFCKHKTAVIEQTMLKTIRENALLECSPCSFTTNVSETANSIHKNNKQSQLFEFVDKLKQVIDDQEEVEKAVIQRGKYRSKPQFKHLKVAKGQWYKMTSQHRRKHLDRVAHALVGIEASNSVPPTSSLKVHVHS